MADRVPVRIAHAYGNTREAIATAIDAGVDMIEADIWWRRGRIFVHHDRHLAPLPILADRRMKGHKRPPWSVPLPGGYYMRPDAGVLTLAELIERTRGKARLLLDVKGHDGSRYAEEFAEGIAECLGEVAAGEAIEVCGQTWPVLLALRERAPGLHVRFSIERPDQWDAFTVMVQREGAAPDVCIQHRFLTDDRLRFLKEHGAGIYTWTVDDPTEARALLERGVDGIISNDLRLLRSLAAPAAP